MAGGMLIVLTGMGIMVFDAAFADRGNLIYLAGLVMLIAGAIGSSRRG